MPVPDGVADCFADHGFGVVGQRGTHNGQRPAVVGGGAQVGAAELREHVVEALPKPGEGATVEVEDRGADVGDDCLEFVDGFGESLLDVAGPNAWDGALQRQADCEQPLDDMVVEVTGKGAQRRLLTSSSSGAGHHACCFAFQQ